MTAEDQLLRLRERVSRLRSLSLLGGASLSGDLKRLQKQIEQLEAAPALTIRRSSPGSGASTAGQSHWWASRRAATSRSARTATSAWRTRRATGRRCAS